MARTRGARLALVERPAAPRAQPLPAAIEAPIVVASHRGPTNVVRDADGRFRPTGHQGSLADALSGVLFDADAVWFAVADAAPSADPTPMRRPSLSPGLADRYAAFVGEVLQPHMHGAVATRAAAVPGDGWDAYRTVNAIVAGRLAAQGPEPVFLVQGHHLALTPRFLRDLVPAVRVAHFTHAPFPDPAAFGALPTSVRGGLVRGMLAADVVGFQSGTWAENFLSAARSIPGLEIDRTERAVTVDGRRALVRVYPVALDPEPLRAVAASMEVQEMVGAFERLRGNAALIVNVADAPDDARRAALSFERFLLRERRWNGIVRLLVVMTHDRTAPADDDARAATAEIERINRDLTSGGRPPIEVVHDPSYERAVAAFHAYDVLYVDPLADGMNLVAMQGPVVNPRGGALVVSRTTGAWSRLSRHALGVDPTDVDDGAAAIATALSMSPHDRARRSRAIVREVLAHQPAGWLTAQLHDLEAAAGRSAASDVDVVDVPRPLAG